MKYLNKFRVLSNLDNIENWKASRRVNSVQLIGIQPLESC